MHKSAQEVMEGTFCIQSLLFKMGYVSIWYTEVYTYFWNLDMFLFLFCSCWQNHHNNTYAQVTRSYVLYNDFNGQAWSWWTLRSNLMRKTGILIFHRIHAAQRVVRWECKAKEMGGRLCKKVRMFWTKIKWQAPNGPGFLNPWWPCDKRTMKLAMMFKQVSMHEYIS